MDPLLAPLIELANDLTLNDLAQLAGIAIISWLGGHGISRGELR